MVEIIVRKILNGSLLFMVIGIFVFLGNMVYQQETLGIDPKINWWFTAPMIFFFGVVILCIVLMCVFEIIHMCKVSGMPWYGIVIVLCVVAIAVAIGVLLFLKFEFMRNKIVISTVSLTLTGFVMKAYFRIGNEAKRKR
ncbi:MAG: hypothetical protein IJ397_08660 [Lachnospiraceae bacterium]|nr:hypothetical protein [Lachnospiraceae bacterium]